MSEITTMQNKILETLRALLTGQHLDAAQQPEYANTGTLYVQRGFETLLEIDYRFNRDYLALTVRGTALTAQHPGEHAPGSSFDVDERGPKLSWSYVPYNDGNAITGMLAGLEHLLAQLPHQDPATPDPDTESMARKMSHLATQIAADYPPDTHPGTWLLLNARILDLASPVASDATHSGQIAQIRYLLEHGDTEEEIRALLSD